MGRAATQAPTHRRDEAGVGILKALLCKATGFKHDVNLHYRGLLGRGREGLGGLSITRSSIQREYAFARHLTP